MALWQRGQVLLNSIASGLSAPTQSGAGIAANAVSPAVSYQIGQYFKELAANNRDGQLSAGQEAAHILAHTVWGAAVAHAGGNNALAGALAAGGPEAAAPIISHYLYQERDGSRLSAEQKETVTAITGLIGTAAGAALGSTPADVAQGSLNAKNAVENNYYAGQQNFAVEQACNRRTPEQCREIQQAHSEARLLMGEKLLSVIDEAARFFIPPYDLGRSLAEAKNGREVIIAIVSALPPAKIFDRVKDLIHAGKELDALKELQRLKEYFSANPALAAANGVKVPSTHVKPQSAPSSGGSSTRGRGNDARKSNSAPAPQAVKDLYTRADKANVNLRLGREHNAQVLSNNLEVAGVPKPSGTQAHHIVGQSSRYGRRTQETLKRFGIDLNSPNNGVFLPGCGASNAVGMIHCGRHTEAYEQAVWERLEGVSSRQEAVKILQGIRNDLLDDLFTPLNKRSR